MLFQIHYCRSKSDVEEEDDDGDVKKFPTKGRIMKVLYMWALYNDLLFHFNWKIGTNVEDIGKGKDEENEKENGDEYTHDHEETEASANVKQHVSSLRHFKFSVSDQL